MIMPFLSTPSLLIAPGLTSGFYLEGRQAVVISQLLSLLVSQVLNTQAESELLQRHGRHVVSHVIDLRVQRERWEELRKTTGAPTEPRFKPLKAANEVVTA